jgi:hypothetical protein
MTLTVNATPSFGAAFMPHVKRNKPFNKYVNQRDLTMSLQNLFYPAVSVGDTQASFGEPVKLETNTVQALLEAVQKSEGMSVLPERSKLEVLMHADGHGSKQLIRYNKVLVGMALYPFEDHLFDYTGTAAEDAKAFASKLCEEIPQPPLTADDWLDRLKYAANDNPEILAVIDSVPSCLRDLDKVGQTHVIVPDSYNMTEEMEDASRRLLLFTDTYGNHKAEEIRDQISLHPWVKRVLPKWFNEQKGHLTKAGRADLAYHLTIAAYTDPMTDEERIFGKGRRPSNVADFYYGMELVLTNTSENELLIQKAFESFWDKVKDGDTFDLRINRHELPDTWRKYFKKQAIEVSGLISKNSDGSLCLINEKIRMGLKNDYVNFVGWKFQPSVKVPKKQVRNVVE